MTNTSPLYRAQQAWALTLENMNRVCTDLNLEWYYDPIQYRVVFCRKGVADPVLRDLEECFGDPDSLQFVAAKEVLVRMEYGDIRAMLGGWIAGWSTL